MNKEERLSRLKDIQWACNAIDKYAVNPSKYRKSHQGSIHDAISMARSQVNALIEDTENTGEHNEQH